MKIRNGTLEKYSFEEKLFIKFRRSHNSIKMLSDIRTIKEKITFRTENTRINFWNREGHPAWPKNLGEKPGFQKPQTTSHMDVDGVVQEKIASYGSCQIAGGTLSQLS